VGYDDGWDDVEGAIVGLFDGKCVGEGDGRDVGLLDGECVGLLDVGDMVVGMYVGEELVGEEVGL